MDIKMERITPVKFKQKKTHVEKVIEAEQSRIQQLGFEKCPKCGSWFKHKVMECKDCGHKI